jgi:hypothetical protein
MSGYLEHVHQQKEEKMEKKISVEQMVNNIVADSPGINHEPLGLRPRCYAEMDRIVEILQAMYRYVSDGKEVPNEWLYELSDLLEVRGYVV